MTAAEISADAEFCSLFVNGKSISINRGVQDYYRGQYTTSLKRNQISPPRFRSRNRMHSASERDVDSRMDLRHCEILRTKADLIVHHGIAREHLRKSAEMLNTVI